MEERLQKIIARAGICSRREAEQLIADGQVTVNGEIITEPGTKADPTTDHIKVKGKLLQHDEKLVYVLLNKPKGVISTVNDPEGRPSVVDQISGLKSRIYPVGRLDFNTEGIMLLTNDGELANRLLSPASKCPKTYLVKVNGVPTHQDIARLQRGITVDGTRYGSCDVEVMRIARNSWLKVTLNEGKNHQVKNMFEAIGHPVSKLRRVAFAFLTTKGVEVGGWRHLTEVEVARLQRGDFQPLVPISVVPFLRELGVRVSTKDREALERYRDGEDVPSTKERSYKAPESRKPGANPGKWVAKSNSERSVTKPLPLRRQSEETEGEESKPRLRVGRRPLRSLAGKGTLEDTSRGFAAGGKLDREDRNPRRRTRADEGDDRPKRGFKRDDDRPERSYQRDEDRPKRSYQRDEDRPERGGRRDDERPKRGFNRDGDRPERGNRRDDERPNRGYKADEERPRRSSQRDEDGPKRSYKRDDDGPKRSYKRDDDGPKRSFKRDEDGPKRSYKRDEDGPKRSYKRDEDGPKRSYKREDDRSDRGNRRDDQQDRSSRGGRSGDNQNPWNSRQPTRRPQEGGDERERPTSRWRATAESKGRRPGGDDSDRPRGRDRDRDDDRGPRHGAPNKRPKKK